MMEIVAAGLLPAIPAERWAANKWAPSVGRLMIHDKAVLQSGANFGWVVRPSNPELRAMLNPVEYGIRPLQRRWTPMDDRRNTRLPDAPHRGGNSG